MTLKYHGYFTFSDATSVMNLNTVAQKFDNVVDKLAEFSNEQAMARKAEEDRYFAREKELEEIKHANSLKLIAEMKSALGSKPN
jgi:hypothetical protein